MKKLFAYLLVFCLTVSLFSYNGSATADEKIRIVNAQSSSFIFAPSALYNGSYADMYSSGIESNPWVLIEMDGYYDVNKINMYSRGDLVGFPISFTIWYSTNGVDYEKAPGGLISNYPKPTQQKNEFRFTDTITAKYIKIVTDKSYNDGVNDLTQYAEIELYGTASTLNNPDGDQEYSLDFTGQSNGKWYQFENMQRESYYLSGSYFIPYYLNPLVGEAGNKHPTVCYLDGNWILLYEGADGIYCSVSADKEITGSWEYPYKLIDKGNYEKLSSPSIAAKDGECNIVFSAVNGSKSEIYSVTYQKGIKSINLSSAGLLTISGESGQTLKTPSLISDGKWKLYYTVDYGTSRTMYLAESDDISNGFTRVSAIPDLKEGTVIKLKNEYAALFKTYDESGGCLTEWAYSEDGKAFDRRSVLLDRIRLENTSYYNSGFGTAAIDDKGIIRGIFAENWSVDEESSHITLYLPQRKAVLAYQLYTFNDSMAVSPSVQAVYSTRDLTITDRVTLFEMPGSEPKYEKRKAIALSSSLFIRSMANPGTLPNKNFTFLTPLADGLKIIKPVDAVADDYIDESKSGSMAADYYDITYWQTNGIFTVDQPVHELTVTLAAKEQIDAVKFTFNDNGYSYPKDFYFMYSDDGENYKMMPGMYFINFPVVSSSEVNLVCPSPVKAKYVKMIVTRYESDLSNVASLKISKIYFLSKTAAIENQFIYKDAGETETWQYQGKALEKVNAVSASASSTLEGWNPEKAIDGLDSAWSSAPSSKRDGEDWLKIDLGSTFNIARAEVKQRSDNRVFPIDFKVQYSIDGTSWTDAPGGNITGYQTPRTGYRNYVTFSSPVQARYLRLVITKKRLDGSYYMAHISEFEAHKIVDQ